MTDNQQPQSPNDFEPAYAPHRSATLEGIINTLEWLLIAFILALVFRAFGVEAFQIPTGSMAETLKGAHYHTRCLRCGYPYDIGGDEMLYMRPECPSCGYLQPIEGVGKIENGDRIFVLKTIYQFLSPQRWDVVVFKNPVDPRINYIKRLVGLPGEQVQIIDGDVFINGRIQRKPAKVQNELWMTIYDNNYQPFEADKSDPNDNLNSPWRQPFENVDDSRWNLNADGPTVFSLDENPDAIHTLAYNIAAGNDFHAVYAYNNGFSRRAQPICGDLMMRFWVRNQGDGMVGACLEKNGIQYVAQVVFGQLLVLSRQENGELVELSSTPIAPQTEPARPMYFEFANVDCRLVLRYGSHRLSADLAAGHPDESKSRPLPKAKIIGSGRIRISNIGLFRDTYYTSLGNLRATSDEAFELHSGEFFVCGDNSPNSSDSRLWSVDGKNHVGDDFYRQGVVPMDYMMGKAIMVYWSDAFSPRPNMLPIIPNIDRFKVIYGGAEDVY